MEEAAGQGRGAQDASGSMHVMTAQFCMMHTTTDPEITAPNPPSTEAKPGPLLAHNDTSASSGGHADEEDYAYKEWGAKRRKKRQHSLTVAVTQSQKWGAQTKADPSQRQAEHALKPRNAEESSGNDATSAPETEQPYYISRSQRTVPISEGSEMR